MEVGSQDVGRERVEGVELPTQLTAIRQRAEAATEGKWQVAGRNRIIAPDIHPPVMGGSTVRIAETIRGMTVEGTWEQAEADAEFIANAKQDIPYLLDRLEAAQRALETARTALDWDDGFTYPPSPVWCFWCHSTAEVGHRRNCKRQQALTEIAGVLL